MVLFAEAFFEFGGEGGDNLVEIADQAVTRELEDGGFAVFIDGDDALRAFHSDEMLNCSRDADGEVEFGCDGLPGATDLPLDWKPSVVADGPRCGDLCAKCSREILYER